MSTAAELHARGLECSNSGRHAQAKALFSEALELAADDETAARVEFSLAHIEAELGSVGDGLFRCRSALARDGLPRRVRGIGWAQLGLLHARAGAGEEAMAAFAEAEAALPSDAYETRGNLHLNRGMVHLQRRDPHGAFADFDRAVRQFEAADLPVHRDKARNNLGYAKLMVGDVAGAVADLEAAYATLRDLGPIVSGTCDQDRAEALMAAGLPDDAALALERAAAAFANESFRQGRGEVLLLLARLRLDDSPKHAGRSAREAMHLFVERGSATWSDRAEAVALSAELVEGAREFASARADVERVAGALATQGLVHEAGLLQLRAAAFALRHGEPVAAGEFLAAAAPRDDEPLDNRLLRQDVRAAAATARARPDVALGELRAGLDELADWQRSLGSFDLQTSFVGHGRGLSRRGIGLALDDGRPEVVLEWADRARALATRVVPARPPADEDAASDLMRLRRLRADIRAAEESGADVRELLRDHADLQRRIRERAWRATGSGQIREDTSLHQVRASLAPDDGVMALHVTDGVRLRVLVVDAGHADVVDLGVLERVTSALDGMRADLDVAASQLPTAIQEVVQESLRARLELLSELLLGPIEELLGADRPVVLVPSGLLAATPWTLLPSLRRHPVTVARSAALWAGDRAQQPNAPRSALLVAGPRVARGQEEIDRVVGWGASSRRLHGAGATGEALTAAAAEVDVLHLAAHGLHSADNPLFSGVELADGPWFGYDIDRLPRVPETVLLSACELGRSTVRWGEEAIGMATAWLHAGARSVIASPTAVADDVACEVLAATHERLAAGAPPAVALRDAVESSGAEGVSPFICFGQGW